MSGLILPPGSWDSRYQPKSQSQQPGMNLSSNIQLNDSELQRLIEGPLEWARTQEGENRNIDAFVRALQEKIEAEGFLVEIKVFDTDQPNAYAFEMEINGRHSGTVFDPDRQVYEVTKNILELPGETGFIKTKESFKRLMDRETKKTNNHDGHGH